MDDNDWYLLPCDVALSAEAFDRLLELIENPPEPSARLRALMQIRGRDVERAPVDGCPSGPYKP